MYCKIDKKCLGQQDMENVQKILSGNEIPIQTNKDILSNTYNIRNKTHDNIKNIIMKQEKKPMSVKTIYLIRI